MKNSLHSGFSLIEVLVTMVLVAVTLLGLMGIQARSLTYQVDSINGRAASDLISQFRERLTANHESYMTNIATTFNVTINPGALAPTIPPPACINPTNCTPDETAQKELGLWLSEVQRRMPDPAVRMAPLTLGDVEGMNITLGWLDSEAVQDGIGNGCPADFALIATNPRYRCITMTIFPG